MTLGVLSQENTSDSPQSFRDFFQIVVRQSFWIVVGYLALGIVSEIMRANGLKTSGEELGCFLDSLAIATMSLTGTIDLYILATATGVLPPFWNRIVLAAMSATVIFIQALSLGAFFAFLFASIQIRLARNASSGGHEISNSD